MSALVQITSWLSRAGGGIPPVIRALTTEYRRQQLDCLVAGLVDPSGAPPDFPADWPLVAGTIRGPAAFGYSPELAHQLRAQVQKDSVLHVHGLWMYPGWLARSLSESTGAVRMVSPHGMLEPWALRNSRWKKQLAARGFETQNLRTASCLHALVPSEAEDIRHFGLKNPVAIIPNGVELPSDPDSAGDQRKPAWDGRVEQGRKIVLYLGRLHAKKGLSNLLKAWAQTTRGQSEWTLAIAGWDQAGHEAELRQLASELGLSPSVLFLGPQFDLDKEACYRHCDAFILPSRSEGLPMVILEAWSYAKPVLMTPQCNLPEGFFTQAALRIEPEISGLEQGLRQLFEMTDEERKAMGERGRALVTNRFTWQKAAAQMRTVHEWMLGGGARPECVITTEGCSR